MARALPTTTDGMIRAIEQTEIKDMHDVHYLSELMRALIAETHAAVAVGTAEIQIAAFYASLGQRKKANQASRPARNAMALLEIAGRRVWATPRVFRNACQPDMAKTTTKRKFDWKK